MKFGTLFAWHQQTKAAFSDVDPCFLKEVMKINVSNLLIA